MIVFIHHSVNPYRVAFFNKLFKAKTNFKVYFLSKPASNRKWKISDYKMKFQHVFLPGFKIYLPGNDHSYFQINTGVFNALKKDSPDFVITIGWNYLGAFVAFFYCKLLRKKYGIWSESTKYEKSIQRLLTAPLVKYIVRKSDFLIVAGTRSKEYLESLGAKPGNIFIANYSVDNDKFVNQAQKYQKVRGELKTKYGIPKNKKMVLFVGGFLKRKGVLELLELTKLMKKNENLVFMYVGFGPLLKQMEDFKIANNLENMIITGFVENQKIMECYVVSDVFILPSLEETWGLVINEAMCAGRPVLVSKYAGSSVDLVKHGINGYIIDPHKISELKHNLSKLLVNSKLRDKMGKESFKAIQKYRLEQNVEVIREIINS